MNNPEKEITDKQSDFLEALLGEARNAISAAREILDRTGLVKKEQVEVTGTSGGIFILPPKTAANENDLDD